MVTAMAGVWPPGTPERADHTPDAAPIAHRLTDTGIEHLKALTALEVLRLQEPQATAEGVEKLQ